VLKISVLKNEFAICEDNKNIDKNVTLYIFIFVDVSFPQLLIPN
jgi:hypothetical protein